MTRRMWAYTSGGRPLPEPVEVGEGFVQPDSERSGSLFMVDRFMEGDRATDGTDIGSRTKRRDYMRANGLADAGDFKEHWAKAEAQRFSAKQDRPQRVEAIRKAMYDMQKGRK